MGTFKYFNPNPQYVAMKNGKNKAWKRDDWPVRAVCACTGMAWDAAFKRLMTCAHACYDLPTSKPVINKFLTSIGYRFVPGGRPKIGERRPTVSEFATEHASDICVCNTPGKCVCTRNGFYLDTDEKIGDTVVYSYWIRENNN